MTIRFTIREFNAITNYGEKVKSGKDFNFIARQIFHKKVDPWLELHSNVITTSREVFKNNSWRLNYERLFRWIT